MDPKIIRGLIVVLSLALQAYAGVPMTADGILTALAMLGIGAAVVKRPGDADGPGV